MKKILFCTWICVLAVLTGCQKDCELTNPAGGRKVTVTANIQGNAHSRVALTPDTDDGGNPIVKVDWKESGETIHLFPLNYGMKTASLDTDGSVATYYPLTQVAGTNRFEGTLPEDYTGAYEASYGSFKTAQDGTLNEAYVVMEAAGITDLTQPIEFQHKTAILKPTFQIGGEPVAANTITRITVGNVSILGNTSAITVTPSSLSDIYIFLPAYAEYPAGHSFPFVVTAGGKDYEATLTIPASKSIEAGKLYTATVTLTEMPYLTFSAGDVQTFKMTVIGNYTLPESLQYSVGGGGWTQLIADTEITFGGGNGDLRLRGKNSGGTAEAYNKYSTIEFGNNNPVACTGDIRTLVNWEAYATASTAQARFCRLFKDCTQLTSAPKLPATTLAELCYYSMFHNCTSLTTAPELKAATLAKNCYNSMFYGCTSLTTAPELKATTLAEACYSKMFADCTGLTTAPELKATTLAGYCYSMMFDGCTSLTTALELKVTTLAEYCYEGMFADCTSLTTAPDLPATTLAEYCYQSMFYGCTGLTTAPELPATTLAENCYESMFANCSSLTSAPELPATTLAEYCYEGMFANCSSLTSAPKLPVTTLAESCYYYMFYGCSSLNSITMLATDTSASDCLTNWVSGVASSGTFTKAAEATLSEGVSGIPQGWTVQDYTPSNP